MSVMDPQENVFIQHNIELLKDSVPSFWIGLYKNHDGKGIERKGALTLDVSVEVSSNFLVLGEWMWIDGSPVDYTNWNSDKHTSTCAQLDTESGQWVTNVCSRFRYYICKMPKGTMPRFGHYNMLSRWNVAHKCAHHFFYFLISSRPTN